jgi:serine/threonine-protein kinase
MPTDLQKDDPRLDQAVAEWLEALRKEPRPDPEEFVRRHPEVSSELRAFISTHAAVDAAVRPLREPAAPMPFGDYELREEIARGGMGVVYRARQVRADRDVALKMIRAGKFASPEDVERFKVEVQAAASLAHPNIVPIYEVGEREGQHFFSMKLVEGGSLDDRSSELGGDPEAAAKLMEKVAGAVHHAHQHRLLHRDLKPANILLDGEEPVVADFGLATRVDRVNRLTPTDTLIGTAEYMAPEVAQGGPPTTSADLWSLGVILYEMLTGKVPFQGQTPFETLRHAIENDPVPPRRLNPRVDRNLESVCLKCLEKNPARRYGSAFGLVRDLERWRARQPVEARPASGPERAWLWCRRKPGLAALAVVSAALLAVAALALAARSARRAEILESNAYTARFVSRVLLHRMEEWGGRVETLSRSPELIGLVSAWDRCLKDPARKDPLHERPEARRLQQFLEAFPKESMVVNWHIVDTEGVMVARTPAAVFDKDFRDRDYYKGTVRHAGRAGPDAVHVSSVYRSQVDGLDKFDICAPVMDRGVLVGVVAVAITTDPTLGIPDMHDERRKVVLVAPWDPSLPHQLPPGTAPPEYVILLHPGLTSGAKSVPFDPAMFPAPFPRNCDREFSRGEDRPGPGLTRSDYADPFGARDPAYAGRWLAGFAPVGNTGFVVIVQQSAEGR